MSVFCQQFSLYFAVFYPRKLNTERFVLAMCGYSLQDGIVRLLLFISNPLAHGFGSQLPLACKLTSCGLSSLNATELYQ